MTGLALLPFFFLSPAYCPPATAQIQWTGVTHQLAGQGVQIRGSIFDRDRNGRVSNGDVLRVDTARKKGRSLSMPEAWVALRGSLARTLARKVRRNKRVRTQCVGRMSARGLPTMRSARGLARYLKRLTAQNAPSGPELARTAMEEKVDRVCRTGRNIDTDRLEKIILSHALKRHRRVGGKTLRRLARKVAQENGLRCGHLDVKTADLTF